LKAPFPYFGGKSLAAKLVWQALGVDVVNYVEPFFGSGAVLLARDNPGKVETVNDIDGFLTNFWRAVQADPEAVAHWAGYPVSEIDLHARHGWLINRKDRLAWSLEDPDFYDVKIAGWWVWGWSAWIGSNFCSGKGPWTFNGANLVKTGDKNELALLRKRPHLSNTGTGIHRASLAPTKDELALSKQLPHLSNTGRGIHRSSLASAKDGLALSKQLPQLGDNGIGIHRSSLAFGLAAYFQTLSDRLARVRIVCGDWKRVITPCVTTRHGTTGIFLDPPYAVTARCKVYNNDSDTLAREVKEWAVANGDNPKLRIVLCGYCDEHEMPENWIALPWKANGGYGNQKKETKNANREKEVLWLSPHCLNSFPPT